MAERFDEQLNQSDTTLWRIERDPTLRTTIVGITVLSKAPAWDRLRQRIAAATLEVPRLRQKVVDPPFGLGTPRWVVDDAFDLDYHLRRVVAPAPGDMATLLDLAGPMAMAAFDRARPLWEFTLVDGLADGKAALVQKVHHSLTDGVGAIRLIRLVLDEHAAPPRPAPAPVADEQRPSGLTVAFDTFAKETVAATERAVRTTMALPAILGAVARDPLGATRNVLRTSRSVIKLVRPASAPLSPVMRERGLSRRLAAFTLPIDGLLAAGHAVGGTLNDAFLAGIAGGMRRYHEHHGAEIARLRVTMPINLRAEGDAVGNNKFVPARFAIPVDEPDPRERMRTLGELARSWRSEPGNRFAGSVAGVLNALPAQATASVLGSMLKAIDLVATNVPGIDRPSHLAGATVEALYGFAPPSGAALSIALVSHLDRCALGIVMDTAAISDPDTLVAALADGFDEVLAVGTDSAKQRRRPRKRPQR